MLRTHDESRATSHIHILDESHVTQAQGDASKVAALEGKLAGLEKNSAAGKAIADVQKEVKNLEQHESAIVAEDAELHKEQGEESALQNTIFEEEGLIEEAMKKKEHVGTQVAHLQVGRGGRARTRAHDVHVHAWICMACVRACTHVPDACAGRHEERG